MDINSLERILQSYGVELDRSELKAAFDCQTGDVSLSQWADCHLGRETLLTPDELAL